MVLAVTHRGRGDYAMASSAMQWVDGKNHLFSDSS
jgi:hypothetical protein